MKNSMRNKRRAARRRRFGFTWRFTVSHVTWTVHEGAGALNGGSWGANMHVRPPRVPYGHGRWA